MRFLAVVLVVLIGCSWVSAEPILGDFDLVDVVVDGLTELPDGILSLLTNPVTLLEGFIDLGFKFLGIPLESFLQIKEPVTDVLFKGSLLNSFVFPIFDKFGLKILSIPDFLEKLFFEPLLNGLVFPLVDAVGNILWTKAEFEAALLGKVIDIIAALFGIVLNNKVSFPVTDDLGVIISDIKGLISAILNAILVLEDGFGSILNNINDAWKTLLISGMNPLFPIIDGSEQVFANIKPILFALLKDIKFPITGVGIVIDTALNFITLLLTRSLPFPLTDAVGIILTDFSSLVDYLIRRLQYPITTVGGTVIPNKDRLLVILLGGFLQTLLFPLKNINTGLVLANKAALLEQILTDLFKPPITDSAGRKFKTILDFVSALLDGILGITNLPSTNLPSGTPENILSLLQRIFNVFENLTFPLKDKAGLIITSLLNLLQTLLAAIIFPLTDDAGKVFINALNLIKAILEQTVKFPLKNAAGIVVIKTLNDFIIVLLENFNNLDFPFTDGAENAFLNPTAMLGDTIL